MLVGVCSVTQFEAHKEVLVDISFLFGELQVTYCTFTVCAKCYYDYMEGIVMVEPSHIAHVRPLNRNSH